MVLPRTVYRNPNGIKKSRSIFTLVIIGVESGVRGKGFTTGSNAVDDKDDEFVVVRERLLLCFVSSWNTRRFVVT